MSEDAASLACDYCEHPPSDHVVLGPCTSCPRNECSEYVEDEGEEGSCSYCGCTPADHGRRKCVVCVNYIVLCDVCSTFIH